MNHVLSGLRAIDALEINSESEEDIIFKTIKYVQASLEMLLPFTFGSDTHDCAYEGTGMWVKMAEPTFTSLTQLLFEPEMRISRTEPPIASYGRILGFTTTHGIYANENFRFSPNLNVLLGGRGAGKSAAIDLLRFAFESEPHADSDNSRLFASRIVAFLQMVGEVLVVATGTDGETYAIIRSGTYETPSSRAMPVFTKSAQVYQVTDDTLIPRDLRPLEVVGIEFYGQGEAVQLAERVNEQLRLLDENIDHSKATESIQQSLVQLQEDEQILLDHQAQLEDFQAQAAQETQLKERRNQLASTLADPIFADRQRWDNEKLWIQAQQEWLRDRLSQVPESMPLLPELPINIEESAEKEVLSKIQKASENIFIYGRDSVRQFREKLSAVLTEIAGYRTEWDAAFDIAEENYHKRLADLGAASLRQAAAEQRRVDQELTRIENTIKPKITQTDAAIASLTSCRSTLLAELKASRADMAQARSTLVDDLNRRLVGNVKIEMTEIDNTMYFEALDTPLHGSGMQRREEQVILICEKYTPEEFVTIVRDQEVAKLSSIGVSDANAARIVSSITVANLYKIERVDIPKLPSISIKREGENHYTKLSNLSVGEKCSAILSIALLNKEKPLVIDQPEDDLDHAFIVNSIVGGIRTAKARRQIIAATHNPNVPVLGDAEMIFRVARRVGQDVCHIQSSGGLELPQVTVEVQSLEGGAEAFERRRKRYSGVS